MRQRTEAMAVPSPQANGSTLPGNSCRGPSRPDGWGWRSRLDYLIQQHVHLKQSGDGRRTGLCTRRNITAGLFRLFSVLRLDLQFKISNPRRLDVRHLRALFDWMERKWEAGELKSSTIQGYVSYLRILCGWIGRPELMDEVGFCNPDCGRRRQVAEVDKSWEGNDLQIAGLIERAWDIEPWVAMALLAQAAFGLRRKEALCLVPARDYLPASGALAVTRGTKGGRSRIISNLTEWQYEVIAALTDFCRREGRRTSHIGGTERDLKSNLRRYTYVLGAKLGVTQDLVGTTGHGLRAGFACRVLAAHGVTAPVKGGDVSQAPKELRDHAYTAATEALGHSRRSVVGMYAGSTRQRGDVPHPDGQDQQRLNPPDMEGLIAKLRTRRKEWLAADRLRRTLARKAGLVPEAKSL